MWSYYGSCDLQICTSSTPQHHQQHDQQQQQLKQDMSFMSQLYISDTKSRWMVLCTPFGIN